MLGLVGIRGRGKSDRGLEIQVDKVCGMQLAN